MLPMHFKSYIYIRSLQLSHSKLSNAAELITKEKGEALTVFEHQRHEYSTPPELILDSPR